MSRGEIWSVAGGVYATKPRPAVVIQDDRFDANSSVTVCPFTSMPVDAPLLRLRVDPDRLNGLQTASWVMIDKVTTVRRTHMTNRIGRLASAQMLDLERLLMVFLGLAD
ncbi:mRNA interferase MazF [Paramicrobacterium humi]|uniref:mRNA interferase MazF n=1 Tax=Paramicrobacterium humi TaxID=640635 RepID=A0A1H4IRV3_9MICO|nr:type II toxin-antitoxin system PemK/MazF family toxin [Microbacterium humi]SEB36575.1 mRNA interferase MazF [Microbacterium humi]